LQDESGGEWRDYGVETYSGGAEYGLSVADFHLTAGGAYHHFRHVRTPQDELGEDNGAADYQLGLAYTPLDWLEVHAAGAHKTAFPDLHSLYSAEGNPDLKPEEAYNVDAGLRLHPVPEFGLVATWFYSAVRNLIGKREFGNEYSYENIDEATITGVENEIDVNVARGLFTIGLGYTYLSTRDERPSRRLEQLDFRPAHTAFADGRLNLPFGTSLAVQYFYVGERKYEEPSKDRTVRSLPEYGLFNARLAHRLSWDERRVAAEFFLQGKNLLDVYYETAPEKAATGRMLSGGVAVDF
jgi:outer membrane receptor protein involved in Fe transport